MPDAARSTFVAGVGPLLRGARRPLPKPGAKEGWLRIQGAHANNLKRVDVRIPLGRLTVITGVSGSGKSSLMHSVLRPAVASVLRKGGPGGLQIAFANSLLGIGKKIITPTMIIMPSNRKITFMSIACNASL